MGPVHLNRKRDVELSYLTCQCTFDVELTAVDKRSKLLGDPSWNMADLYTRHIVDANGVAVEWLPGSRRIKICSPWLACPL